MDITILTNVHCLKEPLSRRSAHLKSGVSLPLGLNSRLSEDSPVLEPSSSPNEHLPLLVLGCWARGVLLSALYLVRSASPKQRHT